MGRAEPHARQAPRRTVGRARGPASPEISFGRRMRGNLLVYAPHKAWRHSLRRMVLDHSHPAATAPVLRMGCPGPDPERIPGRAESSSRRAMSRLSAGPRPAQPSSSPSGFPPSCFSSRYLLGMILPLSSSDLSTESLPRSLQNDTARTAVGTLTPLSFASACIDASTAWSSAPMSLRARSTLRCPDDAWGSRLSAPGFRARSPLDRPWPSRKGRRPRARPASPGGTCSAPPSSAMHRP